MTAIECIKHLIDHDDVLNFTSCICIGMKDYLSKFEYVMIIGATLVGDFKKHLIYQDFHAQSDLVFTENAFPQKNHQPNSFVDKRYQENSQTGLS